MEFLSNHLEWSPQSIADLYRCRWDIEKFFKSIKQSLQLCDFLGNNANAVHWQLWTALLVYVLLRYLAWLSQWTHSFYSPVGHGAHDVMAQNRSAAAVASLWDSRRRLSAAGAPRTGLLRCFLINSYGTAHRQTLNPPGQKPNKIIWFFGASPHPNPACGTILISNFKNITNYRLQITKRPA